MERKRHIVKNNSSFADFCIDDRLDNTDNETGSQRRTNRGAVIATLHSPLKSEMYSITIKDGCRGNLCNIRNQDTKHFTLQQVVSCFDVSIGTQPAGAAADWQFRYLYPLIQHVYKNQRR